MDNQVTSTNGPLSGMRVIDWTMWQFGPVSTMMLADLGAEVIKVESLEGDHGRLFVGTSGVSADLGGGVNAYFAALNRQKKGLAVDLKHPKGKDIMYDLVKQSDIFVQNFRQGVAERLGLGYDDLIKHNPRLIYGSASGYGPKGPDSGKPAFALTGEARAGSLWWAGPDDGTPYNISGVADQIAGIMLSYGILGALLARERFGIGQKVDVSHLGSLMWLGNMRDGIALLTGKPFERQNRQRVHNVLWNYYKCQDGKWLAFSMGQSDRYWPTFCAAIDRADLVTNSRFNSMAARRQNVEELVALLDAVFATRTRDAWEQLLTNAGDLIWERVQTVLDLPHDPQVIANKYLTEFEHPVLGRTTWHQTPVSYSQTPVSTRKMAPQHGEDTQDILHNLLGYSPEDITALQEAKVIV
jgi:crotonobetainyl-CoA:carnitine CoA-transferase CaiB-like acyl-CoA transferase